MAMALPAFIAMALGQAALGAAGGMARQKLAEEQLTKQSTNKILSDAITQGMHEGDLSGITEDMVKQVYGKQGAALWPIIQQGAQIGLAARQRREALVQQGLAGTGDQPLPDFTPGQGATPAGAMTPAQQTIAQAAGPQSAVTQPGPIAQGLQAMPPGQIERTMDYGSQQSPGTVTSAQGTQPLAPAPQPQAAPARPQPQPQAQPQAVQAQPSEIVNALVQAGAPQPGRAAEGGSSTLSVEVAPGVRKSVTQSTGTPEARGRRILAMAAKMQAQGVTVTADHLIEAADRAQAIIPQAQLEQRLTGLSTRAFRDAKAELADSGLEGPALDREASRRAFDATGFVNPKLPSPWADEAEGRQLAVSRVWGRVQAGTPVIKALNDIQTSRLPLHPEDRKAILQQHYGDTLTKLVASGMPRGQAILAAMASVNNEPGVAPPADVAMATAAPQVKPDTAEILGSQGLTPGTATPAQIGAARTQAQKEETGQAGARATAAKAGTESVTVRAPERLSQETGKIITTYKQGLDIQKSYNPDYTGPVVGAHVRIPLTNIHVGIKTMAEALNQLGENEVQFRSNLNDFLNQAAFLLGGVRIEASTNPAAFQRVVGPMPQLTNPPDVFNARMNAVLKRLESKHATNVEEARAQNYRDLPALPKAGGAPASGKRLIYNPATKQIEEH